MRGKSAVGAEISGPALPRFTSGSGSCELGEGGGFARTMQRVRAQFSASGLCYALQNVLSMLYLYCSAL